MLPIMFLVCSLSAIAIDVSLNVQEKFVLGERLSFSYTLASQRNEAISYSPHIFCPKAPVAHLEKNTAELKANEPFTSNYSGFMVTDDTETQNCSAYLTIYGIEEMKVEKKFRIISVLPYEFRLVLCEDSRCTKKKKVFVQNEGIYMDFISSLDDVNVRASLLLPGGTSQQISLPLEIGNLQPGTYTLMANSSKIGFKTYAQKTSFGVLAARNDPRRALAGQAFLQPKGSIKEEEKDGMIAKILRFLKNIFD